jgi:hypothetical protein
MTSPKQLMLVLLQQGYGCIGFPNVMNNKMKMRNPILKFDMHHHELSLSTVIMIRSLKRKFYSAEY